MLFASFKSRFRFILSIGVLVLTIIILWAILRGCFQNKADERVKTVDRLLTLPHGFRVINDADQKRIEEINFNFENFQSLFEKELELSPDFITQMDPKKTRRYESTLMLLAKINSPESAALIKQSIDDILEYLEPDWKRIHQFERGKIRELPPATNTLLGLVQLAIQNLAASGDPSLVPNAYDLMERVDIGTRISLLQYLSVMAEQDSIIVDRLRRRVLDSHSILSRDPTAKNILKYLSRLKRIENEER